MKNFTDAPVSLNIQVVTPSGFPGQLTFRGDDWTAIKDAYLLEEKELIKEGFKPQAVRTFGGVKSQREPEYVAGRICPKCKNKLIYFESKGKKHIKCSTSKYDWTTKKSTGCDFILWDDNKAISNIDKNFPDVATEAQKNLITKLQTEGKIGIEVDSSSLTKIEANEIINSAIRS